MGKSLLLLYIITVGFHYYQSLTVAFDIVKSSRPKESCNFIKKEFLAQVFSCEFCKISKNTFFHRTSLVNAFILHLYCFYFNIAAFITQFFFSTIMKINNTRNIFPPGKYMLNSISKNIRIRR